MSSYWADLASRLDGIYEAEDFETAAYRLVSEQVLYHSDRNSRTSYGIVEHYEKEFHKVLAPLGIVLHVNRQIRYAVALPEHARQSSATVSQTLFVLVLRGLYEKGARGGDLTEEGSEFMVGFVELQEHYRIMTGRELPPRAELESLLRQARRWGIARKIDEDSHDFLNDNLQGGIAIRPAIVEVLGEQALIRLGQWQAFSDQQPQSEEPASRDQQGE